MATFVSVGCSVILGEDDENTGFVSVGFILSHEDNINYNDIIIIIITIFIFIFLNLLFIIFIFYLYKA